MNLAIKSSRLEREAEDAFMTMPNLRNVAIKYCRYVSPYVQAGERSLVERALGDAIRAYGRTRRRDEGTIMRAYLGALVDQVDSLCAVRMSVQTQKGRWLIWDYEQPLHDLMAAHERQTVQIKTRETAIDSGPVLVKMLANICTTRDLRGAGVDLLNLGGRPA
jgi:hypothetical protein